MDRSARRISRPLTDAEKQRMGQEREQIAAELRDLATRDQLCKDASEEATLSGELRRAVHGSELTLNAIAGSIGIPPLLLDDFLTGERTLRSDVMDRLAEALGYQLSRSKH
jgi:hypothetical protein